MQLCESKIVGVLVRSLERYEDERGWLCELFRIDELPVQPRMGYLSQTRPGVVRGPHEHREQSDCFVFFSPFELYLWDNRPASSTHQVHEKLIVGKEAVTQVVIPPGVVHGYKNNGPDDGLVVNCPDQLYKGVGREDEVDEIRHENDLHSPFRIPGDV